MKRSGETPESRLENFSSAVEALSEADLQPHNFIKTLEKTVMMQKAALEMIIADENIANKPKLVENFILLSKTAIKLSEEKNIEQAQKMEGHEDAILHSAAMSLKYHQALGRYAGVIDTLADEGVQAARVDYECVTQRVFGKSII